jgi:hypothetical protein
MQDLSQFSEAPPKERIELVFLHHSVGSQLLASPEKDPVHGGGLAELLTKNNYIVHEATYGSRLGENTDLFDWLPKFRDQMQAVLAIDNQDSTLANGRKNRVVLFKSCFPQNEFTGMGTGTGDPRGPDLTVVNAKAALSAPSMPRSRGGDRVCFGKGNRRTCWTWSPRGRTREDLLAWPHV